MKISLLLPSLFHIHVCISKHSEKCSTPPTTPLDELALKRHRFFADLIDAANTAVDRRVQFDPLGPFVGEVPSEDCCETDPNSKSNI